MGSLRRQRELSPDSLKPREYSMKSGCLTAESALLPQLDKDFSITIDQLEIGAVGSDEAGAVRPRGERDQYVEMQIAQFVRREPFIRVYLPQDLTRLQPVLL